MKQDVYLKLREIASVDPCVGCPDKCPPNSPFENLKKCFTCEKVAAYADARRQILNPYRCEECFKKENDYDQDRFDRAVAENRLPKWHCTLGEHGHGTPVCGACGKEGVVYG